MGLAQAINETNLVVALSGDMDGARAKILAQKETATGLELDMEHFFTNTKGGLLHANDKAVLTKIPGKENTFMLEINYNIVNSLGVLESYRGSFSSFGLFKLDEGKVILRYQGEICK